MTGISVDFAKYEGLQTTDSKFQVYLPSPSSPTSESPAPTDTLVLEPEVCLLQLLLEKLALSPSFHSIAEAMGK